MYVKFNADAILRGDTVARYNAYAKAIQSGFKKPNEIRALEEDPPEPGGDKLYINAALVPIDKIASGAMMKNKGGTSNG